jgi:hypothetical protein
MHYNLSSLINFINIKYNKLRKKKWVFSSPLNSISKRTKRTFGARFPKRLKRLENIFKLKTNLHKVEIQRSNNSNYNNK